jgi:hypothetical protein
VFHGALLLLALVALMALAVAFMLQDDGRYVDFGEHFGLDHIMSSFVGVILPGRVAVQIRLHDLCANLVLN